MTLTNHMLAGTLIAKLLPLPLALPLAFVSHFVLDSLPHFGFNPESERKNHPWLSYGSWGIDILLAIALGVWVVVHGDPAWLIGAFVAFSPDLIWVYRYYYRRKVWQT